MSDEASGGGDSAKALIVDVDVNFFIALIFKFDGLLCKFGVGLNFFKFVGYFIKFNVSDAEIIEESGGVGETTALLINVAKNFTVNQSVKSIHRWLENYGHDFLPINVVLRLRSGTTIFIC